MEIFEENEIASLEDTIRTIAEDGHKLICQSVECFPDKCKEKGCALKSALFYLNELDKHRMPIPTGKKFHVTLDKVCPQCGELVNSRMSFCPSCGKEIFGKGNPFEECDCPLTLQELENLEEKPIYVVVNYVNAEKKEENGFWTIVKNVITMSSGRRMIHLSERLLPVESYGKTWLAFRNEVES